MAERSLLDALIQFSQPQAYNPYQYGASPFPTPQPSGWDQIMGGLQGFAAMENKPLEHLSKLAGAAPQVYGNAYASSMANLADPDRALKNQYLQAQIGAMNDPFDRLARIQQLGIQQQNADRLLREQNLEQQQSENRNRILRGLPPISPVVPPQVTEPQFSPMSGGGMSLPTDALGQLSDLTKAQIQVESGGNPNAVSPKGARGLMQLMPGTQKDPGFGIIPARDDSPEENVRVGQEYQAALTDKYKDPKLALMAYNWGPGNVDKWMENGADPNKVPRETSQYVEKVLSKVPTQTVENVQPMTSAMSLPSTNEPILQNLPVFQPTEFLKNLESDPTDPVLSKAAERQRKKEREAHEDKVKVYEDQLKREEKEAKKKEGKALTESESKTLVYADRLREADPIINKFSSFNTLAEQSKSAVPVVGNFLVSPEYQQFDQAKRNFVNATLRRESGAVISPDEFENANKQYFPQPGDSEEVIAQKAGNRKTVIEGFAKGAGQEYMKEFQSNSKPREKSGGGLTVGKYTFPTQEAADAFRKATGQ